MYAHRIYAHRKQIQIWNPHDLSFSLYILFLFYAFSFISSCTTKNITPNHAWDRKRWPTVWPARCHRRHSLTDLLFEVVYVIDRSLIDSIHDIFLKKVQIVWGRVG